MGVTATMILVAFDEAMRSEWLPEWLCAAGYSTWRRSKTDTVNTNGMGYLNALDWTDCAAVELISRMQCG